MDLIDELKAFVATAQTGSFTAAATSLGFTQPAISQMVRRLEQRTGTFWQATAFVHPDYYFSGDIIAKKCHVPHLYRFELFGTPDDVTAVQHGLEQFWKQQ